MKLENRSVLFLTSFTDPWNSHISVDTYFFCFFFLFNKTTEISWRRDEKSLKVGYLKVFSIWKLFLFEKNIQVYILIFTRQGESIVGRRNYFILFLINFGAPWSERKGSELMSWTFLSHFRKELHVIMNDFLKTFSRCLRLSQLQFTFSGFYCGSVSGDIAENLDVLIARN